MTKEIQLTQGKVALVDDGDFEELNKHKWCVNKIKNNWYAVRRLKISEDGEAGKMVKMQNIIMQPPEGFLVDHKDLDGLNNTRNNLRIATRQQNNCNRKASSKNKTGLKGVYWIEDCHKWQSLIRVDKKQINLGYFNSPEEAARAYDTAAIKYHGEFACLNYAIVEKEKE